MPTPPFEMGKGAHRPHGIAAVKERDPGFLHGILAGPGWDPCKFRLQADRIAYWRQRAAHLPCTDTRTALLDGGNAGPEKLLHR